MSSRVLGITLDPPAPECGGTGAPLCLESLQGYIRELETTVSELREARERLVRERSKAVAQKSSCDAEVARLHATIHELKAENTALTRQLRHSVEPPTMAQLRADNEQLHADNNVLMDKLSRSTAVIDALKVELTAARSTQRAREVYDRKVAEMDNNT